MTRQPSEPKLYGIPESRWGAPVARVQARLGYGSYVSRRHRYLYVETPKAACTRLKMLIHRLEGLPPVRPAPRGVAQSKPYMFVHVRDNFPMPSLTRLAAGEAESILAGNGYFRFCFVRNPYSRLVSVWRNKIYLVEPRYEAMYRRAREFYPEHLEGRFLGFAGFVRFLRDARNSEFSNPHWALQTSLLFPVAIPYDLIGRVETFDAGIAAVEKAIGVSFGTQHDRRSANASAPGDWRSYYDEDLAEQVYELYRQDFEMFGYERDSWRGGAPLPEKTPREAFLEEEIFERNRMISLLYDALGKRE